jgi:hypothetical protein
MRRCGDKSLATQAVRPDNQIYRPAKRRRLVMMNALPALIIIWAIFTGLFLSLLAYNSTISRYEEGQLFLDETKAGYEQTQSSIVNRINKVIPYIRVTGVLSAVMTVLVIALYTLDAWREIH